MGVKIFLPGMQLTLFPIHDTTGSPEQFTLVRLAENYQEGTLDKKKVWRLYCEKGAIISAKLYGTRTDTINEN